MTLEEFAKKAGVTLIECSPDWGGRVGYKTKDSPNSSVCGYRTAQSAYRGWLKGEFGEQASKAILKLLKATQK